MEKNLEKVQKLARDLRKQEPRSASEELGGHQLAARCLDKCRASLVGWQGEYKFNCPLDQEFFSEAGLDAQEFREFVASGASDTEVGQWIEEHAHVRR